MGEVECLVLERAAFIKLLLPSADRTFEEEMTAREAQTASAGRPGGGFLHLLQFQV